MEEHMMRLMPLTLLCAAFVLPGCRGSRDAPGHIVLPGMVYSVPYGAYDTNPVTGSTLRAPPDGTTPLGVMPFMYAATQQDAARAGQELSSPLTSGATPEAVRKQLPRGKKVFDVFCAVCHGVGGEGDGPIIGRFPNPPNLLAQHAINMPDGQMYHVVYHGQGLMPGYAAQIDDSDRWRTVLYVRWLQELQLQKVAPDGGEVPNE